MLAPQEENDNEVRREDQENINRFARLNARVQLLRQQKEQIQKELEGLDDASTELMMGSGDQNLMLLAGEAFLEVSEEEATEMCEKQSEKLQEKVASLTEEEEEIVAEQAKLKTLLYGRFGKSINLEA